MTIAAALAEVLRRNHPDADIRVTLDGIAAIITVDDPEGSMTGPLTVTAQESDLRTGLDRNRDMLARSWPGLDLEHACAEMLGVHVEEVLDTRRPGESELMLRDGWQRPPVSLAVSGRDEPGGWKIVSPSSGETYEPDEGGRRRAGGS